MRACWLFVIRSPSVAMRSPWCALSAACSAASASATATLSAATPAQADGSRARRWSVSLQPGSLDFASSSPRSRVCVWGDPPVAMARCGLRERHAPRARQPHPQPVAHAEVGQGAIGPPDRPSGQGDALSWRHHISEPEDLVFISPTGSARATSHDLGRLRHTFVTLAVQVWSDPDGLPRASV